MHSHVSSHSHSHPHARRHAPTPTAAKPTHTHVRARTHALTRAATPTLCRSCRTMLPQQPSASPTSCANAATKSRGGSRRLEAARSGAAAAPAVGSNHRLGDRAGKGRARQGRARQGRTGQGRAGRDRASRSPASASRCAARRCLGPTGRASAATRGRPRTRRGPDRTLETPRRTGTSLRSERTRRVRWVGVSGPVLLGY